MDLLDLDLQPGLEVQKKVRSLFGSSVTTSDGGSVLELLLVASFGRCRFRLTLDSIHQMYQVAIGGKATDFRVVHLDDRVFQFSIVSTSVGFFIYNLRSFECKDFKVFFHFWGQGGAS